MKTSDQLTYESYIALLLVGEPKTGKSTLALAFPSPFFLNIDKNLDGPRRRANGKTFYWDDPMVTKDGKETEPKDRWNRSMELLKEAAKDPNVKTIVIDSLTGLCDYLVDHILNEVKRTEGKSIDRPRIQDYYSIKDMLARFAVFLREISKLKHVIIAAHQKADIDEATKMTRYSLNIPGAQAQNWASYFTDCWATTSTTVAGKTKYEIRTKPTGFHVNLGTSLPMSPAIDITDKTPQQIWELLSPMLSVQPVKK